MTTTRHTAGPWRERSNGFTKPTIAGIPTETTVIEAAEAAANDTLVESPAAIVCAIWQGRNRDRVAPLNERYANARLIAKAPELYTVLEAAVKVLDAEGIVYGDTGDDTEPLDVLSKARALLAEIEGGE